MGVALILLKKILFKLNYLSVLKKKFDNYNTQSKRKTKTHLQQIKLWIHKTQHRHNHAGPRRIPMRVIAAIDRIQTDDIKHKRRRQRAWTTEPHVQSSRVAFFAQFLHFAEFHEYQKEIVESAWQAGEKKSNYIRNRAVFFKKKKIGKCFLLINVNSITLLYQLFQPNI